MTSDLHSLDYRTASRQGRAFDHLALAGLTLAAIVAVALALVAKLGGAA